MADVLRALEGPIAPMICATDDPAHLVCSRSGHCTVNFMWVRVRDAISGALDSMTLADLVPPAARLSDNKPTSSALQLNPAAPAPIPRPRRIVGDTTRSIRVIVSDQDLVIRDLHVAPAAKPDHEILKGIDLTVRQGEVHAIMGPNGSGKTTLAYALMGHPSYIIKSGQVLWKGHDILALSADKRARLGMFLAFQYPMAIPGLSVASFLRSAINARRAGLTPDPNIDPTDAFRGGIPMGEFPQARQSQDGAPEDGRIDRLAVRQRGFLRRREEAPRDAPDGGPRTRDGDPGRNGLGPGHRRPAHRRGGRERHAQPEHGRARDHHYQRLLNYITPTTFTSWPPVESSPAAARTLPSVSRTRVTPRSSPENGLEGVTDEARNSAEAATGAAH